MHILSCAVVYLGPQCYLSLKHSHLWNILSSDVTCLFPWWRSCPTFQFSLPNLESKLIYLFIYFWSLCFVVGSAWYGASNCSSAKWWLLIVGVHSGRDFTAAVIRLWWQYGAKEAAWKLIIDGCNPLALAGTRKLLGRSRKSRGGMVMWELTVEGAENFCSVPWWGWMRMEGCSVWPEELQLSIKCMFLYALFVLWIIILIKQSRGKNNFFFFFFGCVGSLLLRTGFL